MSSTLRGTYLHAQAREMAFNVNQWIKSQNEDQCTKEIKENVSKATRVSEEEWKLFLKQREHINKYFHTLDIVWKPSQLGSKILTNEIIEEKKVLKIKAISENAVYLVGNQFRKRGIFGFCSTKLFLRWDTPKGLRPEMPVTKKINRKDVAEDKQTGALS
ncbi:hypothetical protein FQA39_LY15026 [Lamprigera yunnana]|nr:hypothetical protein FQA39_LY15026 [Lamprigera yunnana]